MINTVEEYLKSKGWYTLWHEHNWVPPRAINPDWAGRSIDQALKDDFQEVLRMNINEIVQQLIVYRDFYERGKPLITDAEFDQLENGLRQMDPDNAYFKRVGSAVRGIKVEHKIPMGSLVQFDEDVDIRRWINKYGLENELFVVTRKLDGSSISIEYDEHGVFKQALTRGDGVEGLDITRHINRIIKAGNIPGTALPNMIVRGEMIMALDIFDIINKEGKYKNPRNYVAGQLNRTVADEIFIKHVDFIAFASNWGTSSFMEMLDVLVEEEFEIPSRGAVSSDGITRNFLMEYLDFQRKHSEYELDGIVIDVNSKSKRDELGFDGLNPEYSRKFKVNINFIETEVVAVHWGTSKASYLKPRVEFEPIELAGVTISFATGFNAKFIVDNNIGPGAIVKVTRSGETIPHLSEVVRGADAPALPNMNLCHWNETGVDLVWNEEPDEARLQQIVDFFAAIDAPMLREGNITTLFELGYTTIASVINMTEEELVTALGENGVKAYMGMRDKLHPIEEWKLAGATPFFGRGIGQRKMKKLFEVIPDLANVTDSNQITVIDGFEEKSAIKVVEGINAYYDFLSEIGDNVSITKFVKIEGDLNNLVVVFTGVRDKNLEQVIEGRGGKVAASFTRGVNVVIAKDPAGNSGKLKKARDNGAEIISIQEARERYER